MRFAHPLGVCEETHHLDVDIRDELIGTSQLRQCDGIAHLCQIKWNP